MSVNKTWHKKHPMPKNPTLKQRTRWHLAHADQCGCRPIPKTIENYLAVSRLEHISNVGKAVAKRSATKSKLSPARNSSPKVGKQLVFQSKLENWAEGMDYCAIPVPASITRVLGTKAAVLVMARVNGSEPFKVSLFPAGGGQHYIRVRRKVRKEADLKEGDRVKVHITVLDRADIIIPEDLAAALLTEGVTDDFNELTPGKKNYIIRRIDDASKPGTRAKRIQEAVEEAHRDREKRANL